MKIKIIVSGFQKKKKKKAGYLNKVKNKIYSNEYPQSLF